MLFSMKTTVENRMVLTGIIVTNSPEFELMTPGCMTFYGHFISQSQSENFTKDWNNNLFFHITFYSMQ